MVEQLFGSKTRVKLLRLFFSNPNRSFYVREITRKVEEQINSVRRELANLLSIGLISSDSSNNKLYYEVDQNYEHYDALRAIFSTTGRVPVDDSAKNTSTSNESSADLKSATDKGKSDKKPDTKTSQKTQDNPPIVELPEASLWAKAGNIVGIVYSGVYTRDTNAQADIVIIGDVNISQVELIIVGMEKEKNKELRYAVFEEDEWKYRSQVRDKFWLQFMGAKKQIVLDKKQLFNDK